MRISDWSSDVCSSDLFAQGIEYFDIDQFRRRQHGVRSPQQVLDRLRLEAAHEIDQHRRIHHQDSLHAASRSRRTMSAEDFSMAKGSAWRRRNVSSASDGTDAIAINSSRTSSLRLLPASAERALRSEEHTSELQSL